jgi:hypothetical protein
MQRTSDPAIAWPNAPMYQVSTSWSVSVQRAALLQLSSMSNMETGLTLTHLRPARSATVPLTIAPSMAPMFMIDPKTEYCI